MKIRTGYVSNSSSSSFCIVGVVIDTDNFDVEHEELEEKASDAGLNFEYGIDQYCDEYIVGRSIEYLEEEQTLSSFKQGIFEKLKEIGYKGSKDEIQILIDGGYER